MSQPTKRVVLDNGASEVRFGYAGEATPRRVMDNSVARNKTDKKNYVGDEFDYTRSDSSSLVYKRPFERGYLTDWNVQKTLWDRLFKQEGLECKESEVLLTQALLTPSMLGNTCNEVLFEEYQFQACYRTSAAMLAMFDHKYQQPQSQFSQSCANLVLDSGYSFTHAVPFFDNYKLDYAVRRLDLGGKALTNQLKRDISYRQWNMMDESHLVNSVKERLCYVSTDFEQELQRSAQRWPENLLERHFVLPNFTTNKLGLIRTPDGEYIDEDAANDTSTSSAGEGQATKRARVESQIDTDASSSSSSSSSSSRRTQDSMDTEQHTEKTKGASVDAHKVPQWQQRQEKVVRTKKRIREAAASTMDQPEEEEQVLVMNNERITIPELLFNPSDIGMQQAGVPELLHQAVQATPEMLHGPLYANVLLFGGNTRFPGFAQRVEAELRSLVDQDYTVKIYQADQPQLAAYRGGAMFAAADFYSHFSVTRAEYLEHGHVLCERKWVV